MGINSLLQQDMQSAGLAGIDRLAGNSMYPQSQMDKTQYSVSSQMPTSAEVVNSGYEPKTDAYTGMPTQNFAKGGIATLRYAEGGGAEDPNSEVYKFLNPEKRWNAENTGIEDVPYQQDPTKFDLSGAKYIGQESAGPWSEVSYNVYGWDDGSQVRMDEKGNVVAYQPPFSTYENKENVRPGYRNTPYAFSDIREGDVAPGYTTFQGQVVPVAAQEYVINPETGKVFLDERGNPVIQGTLNPNMGGQNWVDNTGAATLAAMALMVGPAAYEAAGAGAAAPELMGPTYAELGYVPGAAEGVAGSTASQWSPEIIAQANASSDPIGYLASLEGATPAEMALYTTPAGGGLTAKEAYAAKMGMDMLTSGAGGQQQAGYAAPTASAPATIPTVNRFGVTGYEGQVPTTDVSQKPILLSKIQGVGGDYTFAKGGIAQLGSYSDGGQLLKGPGDGMSDNIPAKIGEAQPARLADGEFVVPADVVSHLGNGSTDAGAKQLYSMMDKIRKARTGTKKQGKQINPSQFLPKG